MFKRLRNWWERICGQDEETKRLREAVRRKVGLVLQLTDPLPFEVGMILDSIEGARAFHLRNLEELLDMMLALAGCQECSTREGHQNMSSRSRITGTIGKDGQLVIRETGHRWERFAGQVDDELIGKGRQLAALVLEIREKTSRADDLFRQSIGISEKSTEDWAAFEATLRELFERKYLDRHGLELIEKDGRYWLAQNQAALEPLDESDGKPLFQRQRAILEGLEQAKKMIDEAAQIKAAGKDESRRIEHLHLELSEAIDQKMPDLAALGRQDRVRLEICPEAGLIIWMRNDIDRILDKLPEHLRLQLADDYARGELRIPEETARSLGLTGDPEPAKQGDTADPAE